MKILSRVILVGAAALTLTGCAGSGERFHWGAYEPALYRYTAHPDTREAYRTSLIAAVTAGRASNNVAPGLLAELGYLYLEDGDSAAADPLFAEEMQRFPESKTFLEGLKTRAHGHTPPPAAETPATTETKGR